ncbi:MAG: hypothetical protein EXR74_04655 [Bdellovibrionales bacterium]|nr:hypothetical protein [Bdellovibrionales bacterium]
MSLERFLFGSLPINCERFGPGTISVLGLSGLAFCSLLVNFFIPLSNFVTWTTLGLGWGGLFIHRKRLRSLFSNTQIAIGITSVFAVSLIAVLSYFNRDTGYYHLPLVTLSQNFPVLPGIANVFGPYGLTPTWFLIEAIINIPLLGLASTFSLNALLAVCFILFLSEWCDSESLWLWSFIGVCLLCLNHLMLGVGGLSPDFPVGILGVMVWCVLLNTFIADRTDNAHRNGSALIFSALAISIKISAISMVFPIVGIIIFAISSDSSSEPRKSFLLKVVNIWGGGRVLFFSVLLVALTCFRSVISSGCVLFPQKNSCLQRLPWTVPPQLVEDWLSDVKYHLCGIRMTGVVFSNGECFKNWTTHLRGESLLKALGFCALIVVGASIFLAFKKKKAVFKNILKARFHCLLVILLFSGVTWFLSAPVLRYGFWIGVAICGLLAGMVSEMFSLKLKSRLPLLYTGLLIAFVLSVRSAILTHPLSIDLIHWPRISNFESIVYKGEGNLSIRNPVGDFRCWNMTPPCTPDRTVFTIHNSKNTRSWFSPGDKK